VIAPGPRDTFDQLRIVGDDFAHTELRFMLHLGSSGFRRVQISIAVCQLFEEIVKQCVEVGLVQGASPRHKAAGSREFELRRYDRTGRHAGWNCSTPAPGGTGSITCVTTSMLDGESDQILLSGISYFALCRKTKSFLPFSRPLRSNYLLDHHSRDVQSQHSSEDARKNRYRYLTLRDRLPNHLPADFVCNLEDGTCADR
jgi:hypothetical protein